MSQCVYSCLLLLYRQEEEGGGEGARGSTRSRHGHKSTGEGRKGKGAVGLSDSRLSAYGIKKDKKQSRDKNKRK